MTTVAGMQDLGELCGEVGTIADVVRVLTAIRDASAADIERPAVDGISAFTRLYTIITQNVLETAAGERERTFRDPAFLTLLDLEFARRYLAAIKAYSDTPTVPLAWNVMFQRRRAPGIRHVNFAAAGVNAHVNFDLTFALLETWKSFPPNPDRRSDYNAVNDIFAEEMNGLRDSFEAFLSEVDDDGSQVDKLGNLLSDLLVRWTRAIAWWCARIVWTQYGTGRYDTAYRGMERTLDVAAGALGWVILKLPRIP